MIQIQFQILLRVLCVIGLLILAITAYCPHKIFLKKHVAFQSDHETPEETALRVTVNRYL